MENIRRVAEVARLMADAGLIVLVSFISPFRAERRMARGAARGGRVLRGVRRHAAGGGRARDPKGLYKKARRGELKNFTGVDSPYEAAGTPEIRVDTTLDEPEEAAEQIFDHLALQGCWQVRKGCHDTPAAAETPPST